ncbi:MAG: hypothetical protein ABI134_13400 [Byssovorax sp.]
MPHPTFDRLSVLLALGASVVLGACHDWTQYDPRVGSSSDTSTGTGTGTSGSGGGGSGSGGSGGGAGVVCTYPLMDDFSASTLDTTKWKKSENPDGKLSLANEELLITIPSSMTIANSGAEIVSVEAHDMTGCRAFVRLVKAPELTTDALALLSLDSVVSGHGIVLLATEGNLQAKHKTPAFPAGEPVGAVTPYDPMTPVYLGISELNGRVTWETSPDAKTWTPIIQLDIQLPSPMVKLKVGAFTYKPEMAAPGETRFDNVNIAP